MTGEQPIVAMRLTGRLPKGATVWAKTDFPAHRNWHEHGDFAEVGIEATDYPDLLDLRFAVGLTVIVEGADADRVAAVGKAFQRHAGRVLTTVFSRGEWPESTQLTDTKGELVWHM